MSLQQLLGDLPASEFLQRYFHCLPFTLPRAALEFCSYGTWDTLKSLLQSVDVDVMVVRGGRRYDGPPPSTLQSAQELNAQGYTILVRHAERHCPRLRALANSLHHDLAAPVNIHVYATPPGQHGFSWHYDPEDVFILQTAGQKEYSLRKNTVHPWPLVETIPTDMRYECEMMPLMRVLLSAGDWLYIPCGYWHKADASTSDTTAISLAVGLMSPSAMDVFDFLRPQLTQSLKWRQRLPVTGKAAEKQPEQLELEFRNLFEQLADDLSTMLRDERMVSDFLKRRGHDKPRGVP